MDKPFFVYRHIRLDNNQPFYIGIGKKPKKYNTFEREYRRAFDKNSRNRFWKFITDKSEYRVEIVFETDSHEEVKEKEIEFIKLYGRRNLGKGTLTNLTDGGDGTKGVKFKGGKTPKKQKAARSRGNIVVDLQTGIFYDSLPDACEATNLDYRTERSRLAANLSTSRFWRAYGAEVKRKYLPFSDCVKKGVREKSKKKVLDLETGIFFDTLPQACEALNQSYKAAKSRLRRSSRLSRFIRVYDD